MENLTFLKDTTWPEVFKGWRDREANDAGWINCATKIKGWPDWASWRGYTAAQLGAAKCVWKIYRIDDANQFVPSMLIGPYTGWQNRLPVKNVLSFAEMLNISEIYEFAGKNDKVLGMMKNFPVSTQFIGLRRPDNGKIVCLEGHHRATAIALAAKNGAPLQLGGEATIALAELAPEEEKILDDVLAAGSQKPVQDKAASWLKNFSNGDSKWKKIVGVVFIVIGLLALVTPLTPGSWLAFVGLELLGIRFLAADKIKRWFK